MFDTVGKKPIRTQGYRHMLTPVLGSLGIPRIPWLERIGIQRKAVKEFCFYDTAINDYIENAFQALALDEHRAAFSPAVWEKARSGRTVSNKSTGRKFESDISLESSPGLVSRGPFECWRRV